MRQASLRLPLKALIWPRHSHLRKENPEAPGLSQHLRWDSNPTLSPVLGQNIHDGEQLIIKPPDKNRRWEKPEPRGSLTNGLQRAGPHLECLTCHHSYTCTHTCGSVYMQVQVDI